MDIYDEVEKDFEDKKEAPEPEAKPEPKQEQTDLEKQLGWTPDEVARVRRDIHRMWNPEPEETR